MMAMVDKTIFDEVGVVIEEKVEVENDNVTILKPLTHEAVELLNGELEKEHTKFLPVDKILEYLISKVAFEERFAARVLAEDKTFEECTKYMVQEITKELEGKNGHLDDQIVYDICEMYYVLDDVEIEKPELPKVRELKPSTTSNITVLPTKPIEKKDDQISLFEF